MSRDMRQPPRTKPNRGRLALAASIAVHLLIVVAVSVALRSAENPTPAGQPAFDTHAEEPSWHLNAEERSIPVPLAEPPKTDLTEPPSITKPPPSSPEPEKNTTNRPPLKSIIPNTLSTGLLELIRRPSRSATPTDGNVKPAGAVSQGSPITPMHGAMRPGQSIVYVLDCSGSMGEFGKLALARAVLLATLSRQPETVRFQILAYNSTTRTLLAGGWVGVTRANLAATETELARLSASGRSNHVEAVRAAAALRPDVIVLLTDANDLTANTFRSVLGAKPIPLCVARVTAEGVRSPKELR